MPDMPECTPIAGMCGNPEVAATFPYICTTPPNPHTGEGAAVPLPGCTPAGLAGAPASAPMSEAAAVAAPAPEPLVASQQASGACSQAMHGAALLLASALAALLM